MATIYDVAEYIIERCGLMSAMKLQKLVFYSQAWSLVWDEKPLFEEEFQAWANGPVCPELYHIHKGMFLIGDGTIFADRQGFGVSEVHGEASLSFDEKETVDAIIHDFCSLSPHELSAMTHSEQPWLEAREGVPDGERSTNIISKSSMGAYYGSL